MEPAIYCSRCGQSNRASAAFCDKCGVALTSNVLPVPVTIHKNPSNKWAYILGIFLFLGVLGFFLQELERDKRNQPTPPQPSKTEVAAQDLLKNSNVTTPAERLASAKNMLSGNPTEAQLNAAISLLRWFHETAPEYKEAQQQLKLAQARLDKINEEQAPMLRNRLEADYKRTVAQANPYLNFIESKITKTKGGYALWAVHEFFSQYMFSMGEDAKVVQSWMNENHSELKKAGIVRVGVMGKGPYSSWSYFDLK